MELRRVISTIAIIGIVLICVAVGKQCYKEMQDLNNTIAECNRGKQ